MTRQEEFDNAIKVIQRALIDRIVMLDGALLSVVETVIVQSRGGKPGWWSQKNCDYCHDDGGWVPHENCRLKLREPTDVIKADLEKAKKEHDETVKNALMSQGAMDRSRAKVAELEKKLIEAGGIT